MDRKTKLGIVGIGAALFAISVGVQWDGSSGLEPEPDPESQRRPQAPTEVTTSPQHSNAARNSGQPQGEPITTQTTGDRQPTTRRSPVQQVRTSSPSDSFRPPAQNDTQDAPLAPNAQGGSWDDETNQRVLGPKEWMAGTDEEERARIEEVFEKSRAARFDPRLSNQDRGQSVVAMKAVVDACFATLAHRKPGSSGRLIVAWTAGASGGRGQISNPRIKVNYKLDDDAFEACIVDGAQNLHFAAADGDPIEVEVPFFYDGAF